MSELSEQALASNVSHSVQIIAADGRARHKYVNHPFNDCLDLWHATVTMPRQSRQAAWL